MKSEPRRQKKNSPKSVLSQSTDTTLVRFLASSCVRSILAERSFIALAVVILHSKTLVWLGLTTLGGRACQLCRQAPVLCMYVHTLELGLRGSLYVVSDGS
jgi:hypothetical protein